MDLFILVTGNIGEMVTLFDKSNFVRGYQKKDTNLFEVELRNSVPKRIKTIKQLDKYLDKQQEEYIKKYNLKCA